MTLNADERRALERADILCGTMAGYLMHRSLRELVCWACEQAMEADNRDQPKERPLCGTNKGWITHRQRYEKTCERCDDARAAYLATVCGTYRGWNLHRRAGQRPCPPCRQAANVVHERNKEIRLARRLPRCAVCGRGIAWRTPTSPNLAWHHQGIDVSPEGWARTLTSAWCPGSGKPPAGAPPDASGAPRC